MAGLDACDGNVSGRNGGGCVVGLEEGPRMESWKCPGVVPNGRGRDSPHRPWFNVVTHVYYIEGQYISCRSDISVVHFYEVQVRVESRGI